MGLAPPAVAARPAPPPLLNQQGSGADLYVTWKVDPTPTYTYQNPAAHLRDAQEPDVDELRQIDRTRKWPRGTREHMVLRWEEHVNKWGDQANWESWRNNYIPNMANDDRGTAYEELACAEVARRLGLPVDGWEREAKIPGTEGVVGKSTWDCVNRDAKVAVEVKSGKGEQTRPSQIRALERVRAEKSEAVAQWRLLYAMGAKPRSTAVQTLTNLGVETIYFPAEGKEEPPPPASEATEIFNPDRGPTGGAAAEAIAESPSTRQEAEMLADATAQLAAEARRPDEFGPDAYGGIDFSTLELRYVADPTDGDAGLRYAFQADSAGGELSWGGLAAAQQASDAFFVWLALPRDTFWVNLSPSEPDRIVEDRFGTTDAGRILLEADLQMKRTVGELIHPDTKLGREYWNSLRESASGEICVSTRQWIVPEPALVHDQGDELFILEAPLSVMLESEYFDDGQGGVLDCARPDPATEAHNESVYRELILPELVRAVNEEPEYAELRRVYLSRVAAEWFRERSRRGPTAFDDIIDSGDVSRWPARTDWSPRDVFDEFVKSYTEGEFTATVEVERGNVIDVYTYVYGGVDFLRSPRDPIDAARFQTDWPDLPDTVDAAELALAGDEDRVWLGGTSASRPEAAAATPPSAQTLARLTILAVGLAIVVMVAVGIGVVLYTTHRRRPRPYDYHYYPR